VSRIKWIEDNTNDHRANFVQMCFKVDNSSYIFAFNCYMSYKCFKDNARKFAQKFNSKTIKVFENYIDRKDISNMDVVHTMDDNFKFRIELDVPEGAKRQFNYYGIEEIFN